MSGMKPVSGRWWQITPAAWRVAGRNCGPGLIGLWRNRPGQRGSAFWSCTQGGETHYILYQMVGDQLLAVDVNGTGLLAASWTGCQWMVRGLAPWPYCSLPWPWRFCAGFTIGLRRSLHGLYVYLLGERDICVVQGGGDELTSLAEDVNALSGALQAVDRQQNELAQSYRRFVPERVLSLLGKTSILEVDKQTFVARESGHHDAYLSVPAPGI